MTLIQRKNFFWKEQNKNKIDISCLYFMETVGQIMDSPGPSCSPSQSHHQRMSEVPSQSQSGSTGTLRTKISLVRGNPSLVIPFHLMKSDLPKASTTVGSTNLLRHFGMDQTYNKFCGPKKLREELSAFMPHLPGTTHTTRAQQDGSSLKQLIEKPPIGGKEILPLSTTSLSGFKLLPGQVPEAYRIYSNSNQQESKKHKKKHKRSLEETEKDDGEGDKKLKKQKREEEKEKKKKRKKEKKKKKSSPPYQSSM